MKHIKKEDPDKYKFQISNWNKFLTDNKVKLWMTYIKNCTLPLSQTLTEKESRKQKITLKDKFNKKLSN